MFIEVPISAIAANEFQPRSRFDEEALVSLTESIRELGVLQPILVRRSGADRYELIAGERRWRAARRAGLAAVPAVVRDADDKTSLEHALVENLHREDLNALEEAAAYQQLIDDFSLTQEEVAKRVGKSRSAVANTLRLFQLPTSVQKLVASGELSAGHARALLALPDRTAQQELAARCVDDGLNVRQVEELVRQRQADDEASEAPAERKERAIGQTRPAALLELEELLGAHLDTRVGVAMGKSKGRMTIEFADLEDLERIYQVLMGHSSRSDDD
ncbi:MAG: ParB/RepB/Spo0J family partition protein [Acidimicrobiales bacterium]